MISSRTSVRGGISGSGGRKTLFRVRANLSKNSDRLSIAKRTLKANAPKVTKRALMRPPSVVEVEPNV